MRRVVSVSIGSSRRNHQAELDLFGERFLIERRGTDGDLAKAAALVRELDGQVDAIGLGGIDLYLQVRSRRYRVRDAVRIAAGAHQTPVVDGNGLKNTLEPWVVKYLQEEANIDLQGKRVLMVSAVDRFGMAEAFARAGCDLVLGDLIFGLNIPIPIRSLAALERVGALALPVVTRLPFQVLYPTGAKQEGSRPRHVRYFEWAEVVAGDFHFIRRNMPLDMRGKIVFTNTIVADDVEELRRRGVSLLVTTTPEIEGRSFGTNVLDAVLVAWAGEGRELTASEYSRLLDQLAFRPRIVALN